jgi:RNA polymerase sigma-70 factor, ECF subfamily
MLAEQKAWIANGIDADLNGGLSEVYELSEAPAISAREQLLVARLHAGEMDAFSELVTEYQPLVYSLTLRVVHDREEARDVAQETFLKIYRHFDKFRGESSLKTWICKVAVNQALNSQRWWKRRRREETCSLDEPVNEQQHFSDRLQSNGASPEADALAHERQHQLELALKELKPDFRMVVVLRDIEGMAYEEMASILDISVGTVKSRIARGRDMLRAQLSRKDF